MDKQILKPWGIPIIESNNTFEVEAIHDDYEGFRILLRENQKMHRVLKITFNSKISYRNTDESFLLNVWSSTDKDILGKIFYTISNSKYLDFFNQMTEGLYNTWDITHYAIYTTSDCIDILSDQPPIVEWLV